MPTLNRIRIYPIKSLDGVELATSAVLANGALRNDRRFQIVDENGRIVTAKRTAALQRIRCDFDPQVTRVQVHSPAGQCADSFALPQQLPQLAAWISAAIGITCSIQENEQGGFPDDTTAPGPTLISAASLAQIASWFPGLDEQQIRLRMRANLEITDCEAFWEDRLFAAREEDSVAFQIGSVPLQGTNPCARCVVPSRDPHTGERMDDFRERFSKYRSDQLPPWAARERFTHFYRFAVNTRGTAPGRIQVGDRVEISSAQAF